MADLENIRALLIAQTADLKPKPKGAFGRWFAHRTSPPPSPAQTPTLDLQKSREAEADRREPASYIEQTPKPKLDLATPSPLVPPAPRSSFGRRPERLPEPELVLDQPAVQARRLQGLDVAGRPVGEMILETDAAHGGRAAVGGEVPYFPEDLIDHRGPAGTEPLRPWLKALRNSGSPPMAPVQLQPPAPAEAPARRKRAIRRPPENHAKLGCEQIEMSPSATVTSDALGSRTLGQDLLEALALALAREHETLSDRLFAFSQAELFAPGGSGPEAAIAPSESSSEAMAEVAVAGPAEREAGVAGLLCLPPSSPFDGIGFSRFADEP